MSRGELDLNERIAIRALINRDEKGYPLLSDGSVDWELTFWEKEEFLKKYEKQEAAKHPRQTNFTPKKKKRK